MSDSTTGPRPAPGKEYVLVVHPYTPAHCVTAVRVNVSARANGLLLTFVVEGAEHLALPDRLTPARADDLWKTTCCELFFAPPGSEAYFEFNYSPSTQWAAYRFDAHRAGRQDLALAIDPHIAGKIALAEYLLAVEQDLSALPSGPLQMGISAVIEETDGTKSYWALNHAPGPPDFHNRNCFIATVPPDPA